VEKPNQEALKGWESDVTDLQKAAGKDYLASMGIYIFSKKAIKKLFDDLPDATDFGKEIIPTAIGEGYSVASYPYEGYWEDIGTIGSYFEANLGLTDNLPDFNLFDNNSVMYTRPRMLAPSKIFGTKFNKAVIAEGSIIHAASIERSIIGIRSRIGENTTIKNTIVFGNDSYQTLKELMEEADIPMGIGNSCHIENAIIDKDCCIGDNVSIIGSSDLENIETDNYCIKDGIIVMKKGAEIPNGTVIGNPKA